MYMVQNKMTPDDDGSDANASKTLNEKPPDGHLHKEESLGLCRRSRPRRLARTQY